MKKTLPRTLLVLLPLIFLLSGCWNYREINRFAIIAGVAFDQGTSHKYQTTTEIIGFTSGATESAIESKWNTGEGDSILEALRNSYQTSGLMGYWNHAKIVIIGQDLAREGILPVLDLFNRSPLTRMTVKLLVSKSKTAGEVLKAPGFTQPIKSLQINDAFLAQQKGMSKTKEVAVYQAINSLGGEGTALFLPTVAIINSNSQAVIELSGTAVFKKDKLVGFLDGEATKYVLFVRNEIKGGVLLDKAQTKAGPSMITSIIKKNQTHVNPVIIKGTLRMQITVKTQVDIWEMDTTANYNSEKDRKSLERQAENALQKNIQNVIHQVQQDYGADIFGFSTRIRTKMPSLWKKIKPNWGQMFKRLPVEVKTEVEIQKSGLAIKPLKIGG